MEFWGEQAIADIVMLDEHGAPLYRQTRFYQHVSNGWQLIPPAATLWGEERTLTTPYTGWQAYLTAHYGVAVMLPSNP